MNAAGCTNHPDRLATHRCGACGDQVCRGCLADPDGQVCRRCLTEDLDYAGMRAIAAVTALVLLAAAVIVVLALLG